MFLIVALVRRVSIMGSSSAAPVVLHTHIVLQIALQDIGHLTDVRVRRAWPWVSPLRESKAL
jgi:hypothetical protein